MKQVESLSGVDPKDIAHGVQLDEGFVLRATDNGSSPLYPGEGPVALKGSVLNLGSGAGHKSIRLLEELGYDPIDFDINRAALINERSMHGEKLPLFQSDITNWGENIALVAAALLESVPMVYMGALLENMLDQWPRALEVSSFSLLPGGTVIIGGIASHRHYNPLLHKFLGERGYGEYRWSWEKRMRVAQSYDPQRYSQGVFPVLKVGDMKNAEWGGVNVLRDAIERGGHERDAQHMDLDKVFSFACQLGFSIHNFEWRVWQNRTGQPLSGFMLALRKGPTYDYVHGLVGKTIMEARQTRVRVDGHKALGESVYEFFMGKIEAMKTACREKGIKPPTAVTGLWAQLAVGDLSELDKTYNLFTNIT